VNLVEEGAVGKRAELVEEGLVPGPGDEVEVAGPWNAGYGLLGVL
jgi:hypothetical protein